MTPGEMNRYADATMSWPLMNYFRWGITFYQVLLGKIVGVSHSYQIAFVSMVIPYLLEAGMVYVWLRKINGFMIFIAFLGFVLSAFNVNMLNLWYEGFLGNAYANVLLLWVVMLFAQLMDEEHAGAERALSISTPGWFCDGFIVPELRRSAVVRLSAFHLYGHCC